MKLCFSFAVLFTVSLFAQDFRMLDIMGNELDFYCDELKLQETSENIAYPSLTIRLNDVDFNDSLDAFFQEDKGPTLFKTLSTHFRSSLDTSVYIRVAKSFHSLALNEITLWRFCEKGTWLEKGSSCEQSNFANSLDEVFVYEMEQMRLNNWILENPKIDSIVEHIITKLKNSNMRSDFYGSVYSPPCAQYEIVGYNAIIDTAIFSLAYGKNAYLDSIYYGLKTESLKNQKFENISILRTSQNTFAFSGEQHFFLYDLNGVLLKTGKAKSVYIEKFPVILKLNNGANFLLK